MKTKTHLLLLSVLSLQMLSPSQVLASEKKSLSQYVEILQKAEVSKELKERTKIVSNRHRLPTTRPEFCPLNNTQTYKKTVDSLQSIVTVFKDDCFDKNQTLIDQILTSSKELEDELNKLAEEQGKETTSVVPSVDDLEIDGIPVSQVINGMNTLFNRNKCSNLESSSFLLRSADIIQTFAQFGLYSPSGVQTAYGGLALASILRFINGIFEKRFEFENESDIETFVKLNCAYYDVRNQIKSLEMFDIDTNKHYKDKEIVIDILNELKKLDESLTEAKEKAEEIIKEKKEDHISAVEQTLEKMIKPLYDKVKEPLKDLPGKSAKYQQAEVLGELYFNIDSLIIALEDYISESNGADKFLNMLFRNSLEEVKDADTLMAMSTKDFNTKFLNDLASSFNRVLTSIEVKREAAAKKFDENSTVEVNGESLTIKEVKKLLTSKDLAKREKEIAKELDKVNALNTRLDNVINKKEYSSQDSKDGGLRQIVKSLDIVKNHIYGKYGKQFVEKMRDMSHSQNKNFERSFNNFAEDYLHFEGNYVSIKDVKTLNEDEILNACVDAQTNREIWVYAQKLSELGYDFLSTNNDVIGDPGTNSTRKKIKSHSDSVILARRIITAKNYVKKYENYVYLGKDKIEIDGEEYSMSEAQNIIGKLNFYGKEMTIKEAEEYLDKKYDMKGLRSKRLGPIMIDIKKNRDKTVLLQKLYKDYSCDKAITVTR